MFNGKLYRLELVDPGRGRPETIFANESIHFIIRDTESGEIVSRFGYGHYYCAAYVEDETVYVTSTLIKPEEGWYGSDTVVMFESSNLTDWKERVLFRRNGWRYFNTSLVKNEKEYVILMEAFEPKEEIGPHPFTFFFATSKDLKNWEFMDSNIGYPWKRYGGGPKMIFCNGYYYLISVTLLPNNICTNFIYRTSDFVTWEIGKYNPFLMPSNEDMTVAENAADIDDNMLDEIHHHYNSNNSDVDMCEFNGKTIINYMTGDQLGYYNIAEAEYDGTIQELLENFFD